MEQRSQEYYNSLALKLEQMGRAANDERGVSHIQYIVDSLRRGDIEGAKADCFNQSDKFDSIHEIKEVIKKELFGENEKNPWSLFEK